MYRSNARPCIWHCSIHCSWILNAILHLYVNNNNNISYNAISNPLRLITLFLFILIVNLPLFPLITLVDIALKIP